MGRLFSNGYRSIMARTTSMRTYITAFLREPEAAPPSLTSKIGVITRDSGETVPSAKCSLLTLPLVPWNLITCYNALTQRVILTGSSSIQNYQADLPAYLKQLALERIGDISIDAVQVYTDGNRDDYYRSGSGIYIKSQDHILRIQRRNPGGCSVFRSELIAIDEALGSLASLPNGKEIWILSDSRSAIQHLSNWQSVRDNWIVNTHQVKTTFHIALNSCAVDFLSHRSRGK
ncbi:uncharacterized protein TNCV_3576461 [Trichonephila clavipes]|nr:uncharacterized protein TNCV_3576461 [Trichonephila clavipes]